MSAMNMDEFLKKRKEAKETAMLVRAEVVNIMADVNQLVKEIPDTQGVHHWLHGFQSGVGAAHLIMEKGPEGVAKVKGMLAALRQVRQEVNSGKYKV